MGANGDAGYWTSSSAFDFLVDTDGSDTIAPIRDYPRASAPATSGGWLKVRTGQRRGAENLPLDQVAKLGAMGAPASFHLIACGRTGPLR